MIRKTTTSIHSFNSGFSLIEVLVALIILSVGMLGVLTLQVKGLQFSQTAMANTQAVNLAADMADRIRANPLTDPQSYQTTFGQASGSLPATICADIEDKPPVASLCSGAAMATFDIWQWKSLLENTDGLPSAQGAITVTEAGIPIKTTYLVQMQWQERGEQQTYEITFN